MRRSRTRTRRWCTSAMSEAAFRRRAGCPAAPRGRGRAYGPRPTWRHSACGRTRHARRPLFKNAFFLRVFISPLARPEQRFGYPRALCSHADAHLGHGLFRRMSRVRRERAERYRRLKRACVFSFAPTIRLPFSRAPLKGRHRAAQERGLPRPRLALVFRAVVDGPSQGRRAISAPGRTGKLQPNPCLRSNVCRRSERSRPTSF